MQPCFVLFGWGGVHPKTAECFTQSLVHLKQFIGKDAKYQDFASAVFDQDACCPRRRRHGPE